MNKLTCIFRWALDGYERLVVNNPIREFIINLFMEDTYFIDPKSSI